MNWNAKAENELKKYVEQFNHGGSPREGELYDSALYVWCLCERDFQGDRTETEKRLKEQLPSLEFLAFAVDGEAWCCFFKPSVLIDSQFGELCDDIKRIVCQ